MKESMEVCAELRGGVRRVWYILNSTEHTTRVVDCNSLEMRLSEANSARAFCVGKNRYRPHAQTHDRVG